MISVDSNAILPYTRHEDVFVGMAAIKAGIKLSNTQHVLFKRVPDHALGKHQHTIAQHGFKDPEELQGFYVWQKALGHV